MVNSKRHGAIYFVAGLLASLLIGGLAKTADGDYEQAIADAQTYCDMVAQGAWPEQAGRGCAPSSHKADMDVAEVPEGDPELDRRIAAQ